MRDTLLGFLFWLCPKLNAEMVGRWDSGMVGWWDGGTVGWWDGGMVGWPCFHPFTVQCGQWTMRKLGGGSKVSICPSQY